MARRLLLAEIGHAGLVSRTSGMTPVLLLDEIAAHLDAVRRAGLFDRLESLACQAFMTGTDAELFAALEGRAEFFAVEAGRVAKSGGRVLAVLALND